MKAVLVVVCIASFVGSVRADLPSIADVYPLAQDVRWLTENTFAVGRHDGTMSLITLGDTPDQYGRLPLRTAFATALSDASGVRMVTPLSPERFVSSHGEQHLGLWTTARAKDGPALIAYDRLYMSATSGTVTSPPTGAVLAVGHESGWLTLWAASNVGFLRDVDVRAPAPCNAYNGQTVYGVAPLSNELLVTASENCDICVVDAMRGVVLSRTRYSNDATSGLNGVAVVDSYVVVVGGVTNPSQANLWLFEATPTNTLVLRDSKVLQPAARNCFAFNVALLKTAANSITYFASTQEGLLWVGAIVDDRLTIAGHQVVGVQGHAAAIALGRRGLAVVGGDSIHVLNTTAPFKV